MFDLLTYEKGASVLRMLEQHIGPDVFRDGVRSYLKAHAYGNTVTTDLWDALEDASGAPVRDVMNTFILQGGHPLVTLHGDTLSQRPFELGPVPPGTTSSIGDLVERTRRGPRPAGRGQTGRADGPPGARGRAGAGARGGRGVGRGQCRGLGRVPRRLRTRAPPGPGHAPARADIARAGRPALRHLGHHAGRPVGARASSSSLASHLGLESDPAPWSSVAAALNLCNRIALPEDRGALHRAVAALVGPVHRHLGFDAQPGEGERTPALRALAISLLGTVGADDAVRAEAARRFDASPIGGGSGEPIPPDIETATLAVVAQLVRPGDYDALLGRYRAALTPQEELRSLGALTTFPDVDLCLRTFDLAMTEVRSQNGFSVIGSLLANPVACQAVWVRMTETWDAMLERFPKNAPPRMLELAAGPLRRRRLRRGAAAFLRDHPLASGPRRVAQSIERLRVNVAFAAPRTARLAESLQAATSSPGS